ncbi:Beta-hexosaminidase [Fasciolopsis buskii]|uniref:beta-N-acetylhexosaminidase n=1 Tax=Fasciolopsis buskii TaxID=27845 RepID=A0A8E0VLQ0_9TREM|nr:Beta-hexosaminidase [Fasciolopsis buski]
MAPVDEIYFENSWRIRSHPAITIPVLRAPLPTFGMILPLPKVWFCTTHFFPVDVDKMRVHIHGQTNYIIELAAQRFEAVVRSRTSLSSYSTKWSHQQSQLYELALSYLTHPVGTDRSPGTAGADFNLVTMPTGVWPAEKVDSLWRRFAPYRQHRQTLEPTALQTVSVLVKSSGSSWPSLEMDESYTLTVTPKGILLYANETWGALHGLTSLIQLLWRVPNSHQVFVNQTFVNDAPRFPHRGLMVDTSRHFISKQILLVNLETMAFHKMNVFHWHIVDDQSYPYQSMKFPNLSDKGAYYPKQIYSVQDVKEVVEFGRIRGIRVIPEFDVPGHTRSLAYSTPGVLTSCLPSAENPTIHFGPLNPLSQATYTFLQALLTEVFSVFKDKFVHLGGDEVEFACW